MKRFLVQLRARIRSYLPKDDPFTFLVFAGVTGVIGAGVASLFRSTFYGFQHLFDPHIHGMVALAHYLPWYVRVVMPALGGAMAGACLKYGLDWVPRRGADDYLEAITVGNGVLGIRQTLIKSLSSLLSVGSGASIGREGSMVQLAAMTGSAIGRRLKLSHEKMRLMVACGATAGITAAYNAPIAGSIFVTEIASSDNLLSRDTLGPLIVASVIANIISRWIFGAEPVYHMPPFPDITGWEVFAYAGLGILCGFAAPFFRRILDTFRATFLHRSRNLVSNMALGGLGVGIISMWEPNVWGNGYSVVNSILHTPWTWWALVGILIWKVAATGLSAGSGSVGGIFTPTLFVGATVGALYGHVLTTLMPWAGTDASSYAMVGMGAFLASVTYAPFMSILMI
ncbi:MAG: chloride channel protein, partial [Alphaproteobacteria bacterium]|nr:chloride channel protein [Alphaproteobacteria bacterium]